MKYTKYEINNSLVYAIGCQIQSLPEHCPITHSLWFASLACRCLEKWRTFTDFASIGIFDVGCPKY